MKLEERSLFDLSPSNRVAVFGRYVLETDRDNDLKVTRRSIQDISPKDPEREKHTKTLHNALIDLSNWI